MVRDDKVDILVELTGHTANNKLGMMACRPAPVQVIDAQACKLCTSVGHITWLVAVSFFLLILWYSS